jgi:hypothetical protein
MPESAVQPKACAKKISGPAVSQAQHAVEKTALLEMRVFIAKVLHMLQVVKSKLERIP